MASMERIWTDQELFNLGNTVDTLRRIRSAATVDLEPLPKGFFGALTRWRYPQRFEVPSNPQVILQDAEELGLQAGNFLAERLAKDRRDPARFKSWEDVLKRTQTLYKAYAPITFAATKGMEVIGSTITHMRLLYADPEYMLGWDLLKHNQIGVQTLGELFKREIAIVAPLSGDFLLACIYRAYLEETRGQTFHLKAAALSKRLQGVILPIADEAMDDNPELAIFLDVSDTGKTGKVLIEALEEYYPDKIIHVPDLEIMRQTMLNFQPSKKMLRELGPDYFERS